MSESSGRLAGKMKWLVARYPKPPGTIIKLGSVLKDPEEPEQSLNLESIDDIPKTYDESVAVRATITSELSSKLSALIEVAPPSNPIVEAAARLQADRSKKAETVVEAMNVRAEIFLPSEEYMKQALAKSEVIKYVKGETTTFSRSVYIIVGVATAESLSLKEKLEKESSASASGSVSAAGGAGKVTLEGSGGQTASTNIVRDVDVDCDFAYRVREFLYSKLAIRNKWTDKGVHNEGAMFGEGSHDDEGNETGEEVPNFDELMDTDEAPSNMYVLSC